MFIGSNSVIKSGFSANNVPRANGCSCVSVSVTGWLAGWLDDLRLNRFRNIPIYILSNDGMSEIFHCTTRIIEFRNNSRKFPHYSSRFSSSSFFLFIYLNVSKLTTPNQSTCNPIAIALIHINFMDNGRTHPKHLMQLNSKINCDISIAEPHKKQTTTHTHTYIHHRENKRMNKETE